MAGVARKSRTKASKCGSASAFNKGRSRLSWRTFGFEPISTDAYLKSQVKSVRRAARRQRSFADFDEQLHRRVATYRDRDPARYHSIYDQETDNSSDDYVGGMNDSSSEDHPDEAARKASRYRKRLQQRLRAAQR